MNKKSKYKAMGGSDLENESENFNYENLWIGVDSDSEHFHKERLDKSKLCSMITMDKEEFDSLCEIMNPTKNTKLCLKITLDQ